MNRRLPVTLVGGFLGAGKTSLLHHFISEHRGGYLAVLVENPGALNLDAKALRGLCGAMRRAQDAVFEIPNGDEAAQIEAIASCLRDLAAAGRYEHVLIEVAGTSSPAWLAEHFLAGGACHAWGDLQEIICVVDALQYQRCGSGPDQAWREFQNEQIAGATLVVLNKCDLLDPNVCRRGCAQKSVLGRARGARRTSVSCIALISDPLGLVCRGSGRCRRDDASLRAQCGARAIRRTARSWSGSCR